jgi:hypothetical protein
MWPARMMGSVAGTLRRATGPGRPTLSGGDASPDGAGSADADGAGGADVADADALPACEGPGSPGRKTIHRLNRVEYDETVAALLGTETKPADDFPIDDLGRGFDNLAALLSVSPLLVEKHERAVLALVDEALQLTIHETAVALFEAEELPSDTGAPEGITYNLWTNGSVTAELVVEAAGVHLVEVRAFATQAGDELAKMAIEVDSAQVVVDVAAVPEAPARYAAAFQLSAGKHAVRASFLNDAYDPEAGADRNLLVDYIRVEGPFRPAARVVDLEGETAGPAVSEPLGAPWAGDGAAGLEWTLTEAVAGEHRLELRGLGDAVVRVDGAVVGEVSLGETAAGMDALTVSLGGGAHTIRVEKAGASLLLDRLSVLGPLDLDPPTPSASRLSLLGCAPPETPEAQCLRETWRAFASRAWRRPATDEELDRLATLAPLVPDAPADLDFAADLGFEGRLRLGFRAILLSPHFIFRPEPDPQPEATEPRALDGYELATRLSYAIWRTMPDATLTAIAATGSLGDDAQLEAEVRRLLADPRADTIVEHFAGQWLELRNLDGLFRDSVKYPEFDAALARSMRTETELLFKEYATKDASFLDILDAPATWLDGRLAAFYGIPGPKAGDATFTRVSTEGTERRGLLSQASILTVTSHPFRTSPVRRGRWVLAKLLCDEPPPPPPGVDALPMAAPDGTPLDIRALMALHSTDPYCANCHQAMDPIGFALEHFDAIGAWREQADGFPVDAFGELPDGRTFDGALELAAVVKADPATARCIVTHLFTYLLGRAEVPEDRCTLDAIAAQWADRGYVFRELVVLIASSGPFRQRVPAEPPAMTEASP